MTFKKHQVKKGDSLSSIARMYLGAGNRWNEILEYNNSATIQRQTGIRINDPDLIFVGQTILVPDAMRAHRHVVPTASSLSSVRSRERHPGPHSGKGSAMKQNKNFSFLKFDYRPLLPAPGTPGTTPAKLGIALPALEYNLEEIMKELNNGIPTLYYWTPNLHATLTLSGNVIITAPGQIDWVTFTNGKDLDIRTEHKIDAGFAQLLEGGIAASYDFENLKADFELGLTIHSDPKGKLETSLSVSYDELGNKVYKAEMLDKLIEGKVKAEPAAEGKSEHYTYSATVSIKMEITDIQESSRRQLPQSLPYAAPIPGRDQAGDIPFPILDPAPPAGVPPLESPKWDIRKIKFPKWDIREIVSAAKKIVVVIAQAALVAGVIFVAGPIAMKLGLATFAVALAMVVGGIVITGVIQRESVRNSRDGPQPQQYLY